MTHGAYSVVRWGGCGLEGRPGHLLIRKLMVQSLAAPVCMSKDWYNSEP